MQRSALRSLLRTYIHNTDTAGSDNFSDASLNALLYEAVGIVQSELEDLDVHLFDTEVDTSMGASDVTISLPAGFRKVIDLRRVDNGYNSRFKIIDRRDVGSPRRDPLDMSSPYTAYLTATQIKYVTALNEAHTARLVYSADLADLTLDSQSWAIPRAAEQAVVFKATLLARKSDGSGSTMWENEYREAIEKVQQLKSRVNNDAKYVRMPYA